MIGAQYDNGNPMMYYTDDRIEALMRAVQEIEPGKFNTCRNRRVTECFSSVRRATSMRRNSWYSIAPRRSPGSTPLPRSRSGPPCANAIHLLSGARRHSHSGLSFDAAGRARHSPAADRDAAWRAHGARHLGLFLPAPIPGEPRLCGAADEFSRLERLWRGLVFCRAPGLGRPHL